MTMQCKLVAGCQNLAQQRRSALHLLTDDEERCSRACAREHLEHGRSPNRVWPVIEGQGDAVGGERPRQVEGPSGAGEHGGQRMADHAQMIADLDEWIARPTLRVAHERLSDAPPERLWSAAQEIRLCDAAVLGRLVRWRIPGLAAELSFDQMFRQAPFIVLRDEEGCGLVSGLVGRIWTLRRDYPELSDPEEFRQWSSRGTARVLFASWVAPRPHGKTALISESRVQAFGLQGRLGLGAVRPLVRSFHPLIGRDGIAAAIRLAERGS